MVRYIGKRLLQIIPIFFVVSVLIFALVRMSPTEPITVILGGKQSTQAAVQAAQEKFHLNESIVKQYFRWMMGMFHGDFGQSYKFQQSVGSMITERIPVTLGLVGFSSIIGIAIAIPAGVLCAVKKNTWVDRIISIITIVLVSCPVFLVCILMILFLTQMPGVNFTGTYTNVHEYLERILLPSVALSFGMLALVSRVTRTSMIKELKSKYVETAEAKGISKKQIIFKHAFKNAIIPVITVMSIQIGAMVVGSVLVENVFALPGLGSLLINAINTSDYPIVQSVMLLLVAVFLILNLIVDIIYAIIDPNGTVSEASASLINEALCTFNENDWKEYLKNVPDYEYNMEKAKEYLAKSSVPDGFECSIVCNQTATQNAEALLLQTALKELNITLNINKVTEDERVSTFMGGDGRNYDMIFCLWFSDFPDPAGNLNSVYPSTAGEEGGANAAVYNNSDVDTWLTEELASSDSTERTELMQKILDKVTDDVPYLVLDHPKVIMVTNSKVVEPKFSAEYQFNLFFKDFNLNK